MSLKIAMVGLRAPWGVEGGVEAAVAELAPRLVELGHEVTVYCRTHYNPHGSCLRQGVRLVDVDGPIGRSNEALVHTLRCIALAGEHDVLHLHACGPALATPLARLRFPTVVTLHGEDWQRSKWGPVARTTLRVGAELGGRFADGLIAVSQGLALWAARFGKRVAHIPNGVSPHEPAAWDASTFPMLQPDGYHLFLGRLVPEKGLDLLMQAAILHRGLPIVIVGGASHTDAWVGRLRKHAPNNVIFLGARFGMEKRVLLSHARSFVLPSLTEGMPLALLEAMAAGRWVLGSGIPPVREALGDTGRVVEGGPEAWARAMAEAEDDARIAAKGERARVRAGAAFGWDKAVRAHVDVYERAKWSRAYEVRKV